MKKLIFTLVILSIGLLNQASAEYTVPGPITEWYFGTAGDLTGENTASPVVSASDINGNLYGVFPEVTLEVGDTIAFTFPWKVEGTHVRMRDLRWGLFNNGGDYGTNFLGNNKTNWTGMWVDNDSLQTADPAGNPFNFEGTSGVKVPPSYTTTPTLDPCNGTILMFIEIERTDTYTYNMKSRLFHTLTGPTPISYAVGVFDGSPEVNPTATNSFNTFAIYISSNPNLQSIEVIPPVLPVDMVQVEASADGSANEPVPAQTIMGGQSITNFAIARDGSGTFIGNTYGAWWPDEAKVPFDQAAWGLTNITGDVQVSELYISEDLKSAVFTGNASGSAQIVCYGNGTNLVMSRTITVNGSVPTPTFDPPAGKYIGEQGVDINVGLAGSTIYYTTDGLDPTTNSAIYTDPIVVPTDSNVTIKAFAAKAGNTDSTVATAVYATLTTPRWISTVSGSWTNESNWYQGFVPNGGGQPANFGTLNLSSDIFVTLDGNKKVGMATFGDMGGNYNWAVDAGSGGGLDLGDETGVSGITVNNGTVTMNALLIGNNGMVKDGPGTLLIETSSTYSGSTIVSNGTLQIGDLASIESPVIIKGGILNGLGYINNSVTVDGGTLAAGTATQPGALQVLNNVSVSSGGSVAMRVGKESGFPSPGISDTLYAGEITFGGELVVINSTTDGSAIAAGDSWTLFSAFLNGAFDTFTLPTLPAGLSWDLSQLQAAGYISVITGVAPPIFNPPARGYIGTPMITISCGTPGAIIHYTTDGTPPNAGSPSGNPGEPVMIQLSANTPSITIQAYASASGLSDSTTQIAVYSTIDNPVWTTPYSGSWADGYNWSNSVPANGANVTADFSTLLLFSDVAVSLDGPQTIGSLQLADTGNMYSWTIEQGLAGELTLAGSSAPVISASNGTNNIISAVITGNDGMIKEGAGTLVLTANNTLSGDVVVNQGVMALAGGNNAAGRLGDANSLIINDGATVRVDSNNALSGNGGNVVPVTINAGGIMNANGSSGHIWGLLTLNGGTLAGSGGQATWGTWNLESGVLVTGTTNESTINSGDVTVNQAGGTIFDVADGGTPSGVDLLVAQPPIRALNIADNGIIKNGAGTMRMAGASTRPYQAPTIVNDGRFLVDGSLVSTVTGVGSTVTVKDGATLGGTGSVYRASFEAGAFAELTMGAPLSIASTLTVATNGTLPVVKVNMSNDVAVGTYTLATYNVTDSVGVFDSIPVILTGSVSDGNVGTITTSSGVVALVVGPPGSTAPEFTGIQDTGGMVSIAVAGQVGSTYSLWATTNVALTPVVDTWTLVTNGTISESPFIIMEPSTEEQQYFLLSTP